MKNNKAMTYVLLALVVGIWGYVIYSVLAKVNDGDDFAVQQATKTVAQENLNYYHWRDSLRYDSVYTSPFSSDAAMATLKENSDEGLDLQTNPVMESYDPMAYAPAMDIQYLGFIENEQQQQRVALVQINGRQYYMRQQQTMDGVKLLQIATGSIKVKTDYQTLTINKQ
ncbi:hypothetical protein [Sphingobacterium sp. LRF_L2]|uniref:hypothetical protein n=1 Tax=Sphingobacterium sp. LRF_L2 TaxID=3369421 RepID=UPI003F631847